MKLTQATGELTTAIRRMSLEPPLNNRNQHCLAEHLRIADLDIYLVSEQEEVRKLVCNSGNRDSLRERFRNLELHRDQSMETD